jgi:hypothetical protein
MEAGRASRKLNGSTIEHDIPTQDLGRVGARALAIAPCLTGHLPASYREIGVEHELASINRTFSWPPSPSGVALEPQPPRRPGLFRLYQVLEYRDGFAARPTNGKS